MQMLHGCPLPSHPPRPPQRKKCAHQSIELVHIFRDNTLGPSTVHKPDCTALEVLVALHERLDPDLADRLLALSSKDHVGHRSDPSRLPCSAVAVVHQDAANNGLLCT